MLIVGEQRGVQAKTVFMGFGLGALYKFLTSGFHLWLEVPKHTFQRAIAGGRAQLFGEIQAEISPELTGVGYIIGPRISGYLFGGGVLAWFTLIPAIKFFGSGFTTAIFPANKLIADMSASEIRSNYIYYIGAGAVTAAGLISLARTLAHDLARARRRSTRLQRQRQRRYDASHRTRHADEYRRRRAALGCGIAMVLLPQIHINIAGALLALFFSFLFVTVSSRITGQIGSSSNPISGMTVATLLLTSLMFLAVGWVGIEYRVLALSIGGVVCVAAATAGATSQDLKTGFLVGATPARQQVGLLFGVTVSALLVGGVIYFLNAAKTTIVARDFPGVAVNSVESGRFVLGGGRLNEATANATAGRPFASAHLYEQVGTAPAGKYLIDDAGAIRYLVDPGLGGRERVNYDGREIDKLESPKGQIMALVVDGILTQKLPWGLILIGAFLAVAMELVGIPSLPVAVGVYLPISTSATMFMGGVLRWIVDRRMTREEREGADADSGPGVLFSSGLIAGGAITGVILAGLQAKGLDSRSTCRRRSGPRARSLRWSPTSFCWRFRSTWSHGRSARPDLSRRYVRRVFEGGNMTAAASDHRCTSRDSLFCSAQRSRCWPVPRRSRHRAARRHHRRGEGRSRRADPQRRGVCVPNVASVRTDSVGKFLLASLPAWRRSTCRFAGSPSRRSFSRSSCRATTPPKSTSRCGSSRRSSTASSSRPTRQHLRQLDAFEARRKLGIGHFITRPQIEKRNPVAAQRHGANDPRGGHHSGRERSRHSPLRAHRAARLPAAVLHRRNSGVRVQRRRHAGRRRRRGRDIRRRRRGFRRSTTRSIVR